MQQMRIAEIAPAWLAVPPRGYGGIEWIIAAGGGRTGRPRPRRHALLDRRLDDEGEARVLLRTSGWIGRHQRHLARRRAHRVRVQGPLPIRPRPRAPVVVGAHRRRGRPDPDGAHPARRVLPTHPRHLRADRPRRLVRRDQRVTAIHHARAQLRGGRLQRDRHGPLPASQGEGRFPALPRAHRSREGHVAGDRGRSGGRTASHLRGQDGVRDGAEGMGGQHRAHARRRRHRPRGDHARGEGRSARAERRRCCFRSIGTSRSASS